jgi:hypothetical protein
VKYFDTAGNISQTLIADAGVLELILKTYEIIPRRTKVSYSNNMCI